LSAISGVKTVYPCTLQVLLMSKLGKIAGHDNIFFGKSGWFAEKGQKYRFFALFRRN
jgi:hypothetical protein